MGKSVPTFRKELDRIESEWKKFRKALRSREKEMFDELFKKAKQHASAAQYQANPDPMESVFFSIILEQQMEIDRLKRKIEDEDRKVDEEVLDEG
ncbi:MAG: hypothetical protein KGY66_04680 [Candidatus Thermoplasmatota archaeon]|nr:hypothetical protein [Candidatus Thermoplasmatota archaeon]MBS3790192.1 hypothetical protein [Candidatus Thermoplasmatota archaeon]